MGLSSLDNTPRPVPFAANNGEANNGEANNGEAAGGSLHAMMLDMKRTFDEIVEGHSDPDRAAQILANPFYQSLAASFAGPREALARGELGQLRRGAEGGLSTADAPPARA